MQAYRAPSWRRFAELVGVGVAYYLAAKLGLRLAGANENVTALWPPTGIAVAGLVLLGRRVWPAITIGAFVANLGNGLPPHLAAGVAVGNTAAPYVGALLLDRLAFRPSLDRLRDVFALLGAAGAGAMTISAAVGTLMLAAGGELGAGPAFTWTVWWVGDASGVILFSPLLLTLFASTAARNPLRHRPIESFVVLGSGSLATYFALQTDLPVRYLVLPIALWAALRFEQQGAAAAVLLMSSIALWSTAQSPAGALTVEQNLLLIQGLNATLALTLLAFASVMHERRRAQEDLRKAAAELEDRVRSRTWALAQANTLLENEVEERRQTEIALRAGEERLEQAQRIAHIGSFQWDARTDSSIWTDELYRIYDLEPAAGAPSFDEYLSSVRPDVREDVRRAIETTIVTGEPLGHEYPIVLADGTEKWVHAYVEVLRDDEGNLTTLRGTCQDITDRRCAENALRASQERLVALLASAPDAIVVTDEGGRIVLVNDELTNLLGYEKAEIVGQRVDALLPEGLQTVHAEHRERYMRDPRRRPMGAGKDLAARRKDGTSVPVDISLSPVATQEGVFVFASMRDATQRRRVEEALRTALDREREAAEHLRNLDSAKNAFLSAVSHELRTPLTSILGFSQLLQEGEYDQATTADMLSRVRSNAQRLSELLRDLLDIDRIQRGILEPRRHHANLRRLVGRALSSVELRGHELIVEVDDEDVFVDPAQAERIVENLVSNAAKYTPAEGRIWVRASASPHGGATIVVSDEGPGVGSEHRSTIFEPFVREPHDAFVPGTGIGLALVDRFAKLHGGWAWVDERPGGGAAFHVELPGASDEDSREQAPRPAVA